jgi:hypothetical protein
MAIRVSVTRSCLSISLYIFIKYKLNDKLFTLVVSKLDFGSKWTTLLKGKFNDPICYMFEIQYESFLRWCSSMPCFEFRFVVFNATFNNLSVVSWRSVLLVEETGVPGENHRPVTSHWQTLSQTFHYRTALHNVPGRCSNIPLQYRITQCSGML